MKKAILCSLIFSVASFSYGKTTSDPTDATRFQQTGQCAYCDLSGYLFTSDARGPFDLTGANFIRGGIENRDHMRQYSKLADCRSAK